MRTLYKEGQLGDFNKEVDSYRRDNELKFYLPKAILKTPSPVPEIVDRELDKCDYLRQAREALHHLSTEMDEEMQLKRRLMDSTLAYRQKQLCEGVKRITELKGSFLHLTNEQLVKIMDVLNSLCIQHITVRLHLIPIEKARKKSDLWTTAKE